MEAHGEILERLRAAASGVFDGTPVVFAYLFGSVALGRARPGSDVDVAVYADPASGGDPVRLSLDLAGRLESAARVGPVEVVVLNGAPLPVRGRAVRERVLLYSRDEPTRIEYESLTLRELFDFDIHARAQDQKFLRDHAEGRR